jgi:sugar lactone lactonase YvrE
MFSYTKMMQTISGFNTWNVARLRPQYAAFFVTDGGAYDATAANASGGIFIDPANSNVYVCGQSNIYRTSIFGNLVIDAFQNVATDGYTQRVNVAATAVTPRSVFFRPEGNAVFVLDSARQRIQQYSVTSNFTYTGLTATFVSGNVLATRAALHFSSDGTKVFVLAANNNVRQYQLNVAWTANSINIASNIAFSVTSQTATANGMTFSADGTKMYVGGDTERAVYQYSLSTPWDITTTTYSNVAFSTQTPISIDGRNVRPQAISFSSDGTRFVVLDTATPFPIVKWEVATPWDLSTAYYVNPAYTSITDLPSPFVTPESFFLTPDGTNIFFLTSSGNGKIVQYQISQPWQFSSNIVLIGSTILNTPTGIATNASDGLYVDADISRLYIASGDDNVYQYSITTPGNISNISYVSRDLISPSDPGSLSSVWLKPDGTQVYVTDSVADVIKQRVLPTPWLVSSAGTTGPSLSYGGTVAASVQTSVDGTYFFVATNVVGNRFTYGTVRRYTANTAWDLGNTSSTISTISARLGLFLPSSVAPFMWNPSGTQMYRIITNFSSATNAVTFVTYSTF